MTTQLPDKYDDPACETAHRNTFAPPKKCPVKPVLPPGVREEDFSSAIKDFISVVGAEAVFINEALSDYIDPYDVWEAEEGKRKVPGAAVWFVCPRPIIAMLELNHSYRSLALHLPMNSKRSCELPTNTPYRCGPSHEGRI